MFIVADAQAESLTSRLKTILDMYPDGNPILSELIQNADDAGASVVRILVDENRYESVSLLNPSMAPLQGPSLLVGTTVVVVTLSATISYFLLLSTKEMMPNFLNPISDLWPALDKVQSLTNSRLPVSE